MLCSFSLWLRVPFLRRPNRGSFARNNERRIFEKGAPFGRLQQVCVPAWQKKLPSRTKWLLSHGYSNRLRASSSSLLLLLRTYLVLPSTMHCTPLHLLSTYRLPQVFQVIVTGLASLMNHQGTTSSTPFSVNWRSLLLPYYSLSSAAWPDCPLLHLPLFLFVLLSHNSFL